MQLFQMTVQIIARPKLAGWGEHWGVLLDGQWVAHCVPGRGVEFISLAAFAAGRPIRVVHTSPAFSSYRVRSRVEQALRARRPYDALACNCETFANWAVGRKPESPQVNGYAVTAFIVLCLKAFA
jgi:hypothetical protein